MDGCENPSAERVAAELAQPEKRLRLLGLARWITRSSNVADSEDLVSDALVLACDPSKRPWNPPPGFFAHMANVMRDVFIEKCRWGHRQYEVIDSNLAVNEDTVDPSPGPDELLAHHREVAQLRALGQVVRSRVSRVPLAAQVFDYGCSGTEEPGEVARLIGCTVFEVYQAHRTLKRYAAQVLEERRRATAQTRPLRPVAGSPERPVPPAPESEDSL